MKGTYLPANPADWKGRTDTEDIDALRWHQQVVCIDLQKEKLPLLLPAGRGIAILGFAVDEGVRRNRGRTGASVGPAMLRAVCSDLPVHFSPLTVLADAGTLYCHAGELESAQADLSAAVLLILGQGYLPFIWGGGHELMYGHYTGIRRFFPGDTEIGIINFDAHFDLRKPGAEGATSGTGFFQVAEDCRKEGKGLLCLALGIQQNSNTRSLYTRAAELGVNYLEGRDFLAGNKNRIDAALMKIINRSDGIYLTICMDVFAAAFSPGVSAPAKCGIFPDGIFWNALELILKSGKVRGVDLAEVNPLYDPEKRTSGLAAAISFEILNRCI